MKGFIVIRFYWVGMLTLCFSYHAQAQDAIAASADFIKKDQCAKAVEVLEKYEKKDDSRPDQFLLSFNRGRALKCLGKTEAALSEFQAISLLNHPLKDLALVEHAEIAESLGKKDVAEASYLKALALKPSPYIVQTTLKKVVAFHIDQKDWKGALNFANQLEKKLRGTDSYPTAVWDLAVIYKKLGQQSQVCKWARKLYSKYPASDVASRWGLELASNKLIDVPTNCVASSQDQRTRIKRLQMSGHADDALKEIKQIQTRFKDSDPYLGDSLLADFMISEGDVSEAQQLLAKYYEKQSSNISYLLLLAKAAARSGESQMAVGAYYKAYQLGGKSTSGRKSLFQAAFLSYQFQDYDGAANKFNEFIKKFPNSGLSKDAQWHLAWIKYLKADYAGAESALAQIQKAKRRGRGHKASPERITYWRAMAFLKLGKTQEAKNLLMSLAKNQLLDYYSVASIQRLKKMGVTDRALASQGNIAIDPAVGEAQVVVAQNRVVAPEDENEELLATEEKSDEASAELSEEGEGEESSVAQAEGGAAPFNSIDEFVKQTDFKDPSLAIRFERSQALRRLGMSDEARSELQEIEKRTSNSDYRKRLMIEYHSLEAFNRSSAIATLYFAPMRSQFGLNGVRFLWEYSYPKAYDAFVTPQAEKNKIPRELVWSIIRAETQYRKEAISPVGAIGLMQFMPHTGRQIAKLSEFGQFKVSDLLEPKNSIHLGAFYLARLMKMFKEKVPLTAAAYNAGPHRVQSWLYSFGGLEMDEFIEHIPFLETRNYVKRVVSFFYVYQSLYGESKASMAWLAEPVGIRPLNPPATKESWDAI